MGAKSRICEICGVRERHRPGFFANFPIDEQAVQCRSWVHKVGKEDLVHLPIEKLHQINFFCGYHFKARDFNKKGNRLKKRAYSKLILSAPPLTDHQLKDFPLHVASKSGPAPNPMEEEVPAAPAASSSKTPIVTAITQNIIGLAPITMEEKVPAAPVAFSSKHHLFVTATTQNIMGGFMQNKVFVSSTTHIDRESEM